MNKDMLIVADTRQKQDNHITKYFDKNSIVWVRDNLPSADYMAIRYENGFYKDYSVLIDTKKDLLEVAGNLCHSKDHARVTREVEKAHELGCEDFIFLICDDSIETINDIIEWQSSKTKVKGKTLIKVMKTFSEHHGCRFIFTKKAEAGVKIIELLTKK